MNIQSSLYLTPKSTFYGLRKDIIDSGVSLHSSIFESDRELYTYLLYFENSTYYSKSLIIKNLLRTSLNKEINVTSDEMRLKIENALILHALYSENMTHALKMLLTIKDSKINNRRTANIILSFLFNRTNIDLISLKYKAKIKDLIVHALGLPTIHKIFSNSEEGVKIIDKLASKYQSEWLIETFYFVFNKKYDYENKNYIEYLKVKKSFETNDINEFDKTSTILPIEVLIGFKNFYKSTFEVTNLYKKGVISDKQKIQLQNTFMKNEVEIKANYKKLSLMDLYRYLYSGKNISDKEEILNEVNNKISEIEIDIPEGTCVIWDCSLSNIGSNESKMAPHIKNVILERIFNINTYRFGGYQKDGLIYPDGDSDIIPALLTAIEDGYKNIYILSDGFENSGEFSVVMDKLRILYEDLNITHFNSVFSSKNFAAKELHESIPVIPFTNEKDVEYIELFTLLSYNPKKFKETMREIIIHDLL